MNKLEKITLTIAAIATITVAAKKTYSQELPPSNFGNTWGVTHPARGEVADSLEMYLFDASNDSLLGKTKTKSGIVDGVYTKGAYNFDITMNSDSIQAYTKMKDLLNSLIDLYSNSGQTKKNITIKKSEWRRNDLWIPSVAVVPVELKSFTLDNDLDDIILNWITASETNNYGFYVERSKDGINYETIDFVKGNGTASIENKYQFKDENLEAGKYFYKLKQVDFDGSFKYSSIVEALIKAPSNYMLHPIFPNPFNPIANIKFDIPEASKVNLTIYNILGQEVKTLVDEDKSAGKYSILFNAENLPSGIYFLKMEAGKYTAIKRMTLIK